MSREVKIPHKGKARAWASARAWMGMGIPIPRLASCFVECVLEYFEEISCKSRAHLARFDMHFGRFLACIYCARDVPATISRRSIGLRTSTRTEYEGKIAKRAQSRELWKMISPAPYVDQ